MHPDDSLAADTHGLSLSSTLDASLTRFEHGHTTDRPPGPRPILDTRARAICRAIEEELSAWRAVISPSDARRVDLNCHVEIVCKGERWVGHTESIGARGAFVATHVRAHVGDVIEVKIDLPTGGVIEAVATVAGQRMRGGAGRAGLQLAFDTLEPRSTAELSELLRVMSGELWRDLR